MMLKRLQESRRRRRNGETLLVALGVAKDGGEDRFGRGGSGRDRGDRAGSRLCTPQPLAAPNPSILNRLNREMHRFLMIMRMIEYSTPGAAVGLAT